MNRVTHIRPFYRLIEARGASALQQAQSAEGYMHKGVIMDGAQTTDMSRRCFVKTGGVLATAAAVGGTVAGRGYFSDSVPIANAEPEEKIVWGQCHVNCGGRCIFKYHVVDGKIAYVETDDTGDPDGIQCRACARGRSIRKWVNHPDRLRYPM